MIYWDKLEGTTIKNRYEIQSSLGKGGAGKVYLAKDLVENRMVAIKTSDPNSTMSNFKERFKMEAKILSKLDHPNIIKFYEYFQFEGIDMIAMEYVEGISLDKKLSQHTSIDQTKALKYTQQILSALQAVHSHKVYHRDIKTDNIHINIEDNVKLLDFGIVQESMDQDLTRQGSVIGTISYLAPELIVNPYRKANPRTDIYSLGIMLYQLLTGVKPFKSDKGLVGNESNNNLALKIVNNEAIEPREVDPSISEPVSHFVMKLIKKEPSDRYQNASEALSDLEKIIEGKPINSLKGYYKEETKDYSLSKQVIILSSIIVGLLIILLIAGLIAVFI